MTTLFITSPACLDHQPNDGHPECPERLEFILNGINQPEFAAMKQQSANPATHDDLRLAHTQAHIDYVFDEMPSGVGLNFLDADTAISAQSGNAALHAVGAVLEAVDQVINQKANNAFCAVRPPGHHAHKDKAAGFCLFNTIAIGAISAIERHGLKRVAIVDFDVHHGDGTQNIMWDRNDVLFISTHQWPLYPHSGTANETGSHNNILNIPLPAETDGDAMKAVFRSTILPRLDEFQPELILVSAGFDAHRNDPVGGMALVEADFAWMMDQLLKKADTHCSGRLVGVLEGGYDLAALQQSVLACLRVMMQKDQ